MKKLFSLFLLVALTLSAQVTIPQSNVEDLTTDLAAKQPLDSDLTSIAAVTTTSFGRSLLALTTNSDLATQVGTGGAATSFGRGFITLATDSAVRTYIGLGNVPNADTSNASNITTGTLAAARLPALSGGDATTTAGSGMITLGAVNANVGSFGSATQTPVVTADAKGRITGITLATVTPAWASITGKPTTIAGFGIVDAVSTVSPAFTGTPTAPTAASGTATTQLATTAFVHSATAARTAWIESDAATAHRAAIQGPFVVGSRGYAAGAPLVEWIGRVRVPTASSTAEIAGLQSTTSATGVATAWSHTLAWSANDLVIRANGATPASDYRLGTVTGARTTYSGQSIWVRCKLTAGSSTPPVIEIGDVAATVTLSDGAGTDPDWLSASSVPTYHLTGYLYPAGEAPLGQWLVGHLGAGESLAWMITGRPPSWVQLGGHASSRITGNDSNFAGAGNWTSSTAPIAVDAANSELDVQATTLYTGPSLATSAVGGLRFGALYRLKFTVRNYVTLTGSPWLQMRLGPTSQLLKDFISNGVHTIDFYLADTTAITDFALTVTNGTANFSLADVTLYQFGALSLPRIQCIPVVDDWSGIGGNAARLVGMRGITDSLDWRISCDGSSNAAGGYALLGGNVLDSTRDVIDSIEQTPATGTPTTSIGHLTGSLTTYKASGALTAGTNPATLATRKLSGVQVWVYQSTTDTVRTTLKGHRAN